MTISLYAVGRFKEVVFVDAENEELRAASGLLDEDEAAELADRLRAIADNLSDAKHLDDNQTVLPFYPMATAPGIFLPDAASRQEAAG